MRAGKLANTVTIERNATTVDDYGTPATGWSPIAIVRAQVITATTEEFMRSFGESSETAVVFRIRHRDGITVGDRVMHKNRPHDIKEVRELGRGTGIDLRCVSSGDAP